MRRVESVRGAVVFAVVWLSCIAAAGRSGLVCYFAFRLGPSVQVIRTKVLRAGRRAPVVFEIGSPTSIELAARGAVSARLYDAICGDTEL